MMVPATPLPGRLADMLGPPCFQHASPHEPAIRPAIAATCTRSIKPILPVRVFGDGEWHRRKHGTKTRRTWRKLHTGVDADGFIVASVLTESVSGDAAQVPELLDQVDGEIERFTGDGAYDTSGVYDALVDHQDEPVKIVRARSVGVPRPLFSDGYGADRRCGSSQV